MCNMTLLPMIMVNGAEHTKSLTTTAADIEESAAYPGRHSGHGLPVVSSQA